MCYRVRICVSAEHTRDDIDFALAGVKEVVSFCSVDYFAGKSNQKQPQKEKTVQQEEHEELKENSQEKRKELNSFVPKESLTFIGKSYERSPSLIPFSEYILQFHLNITLFNSVMTFVGLQIILPSLRNVKK